LVRERERTRTKKKPDGGHQRRDLERKKAHSKGTSFHKAKKKSQGPKNLSGGKKKAPSSRKEAGGGGGKRPFLKRTTEPSGKEADSGLFFGFGVLVCWVFCGGGWGWGLRGCGFLVGFWGKWVVGEPRGGKLWARKFHSFNQGGPKKGNGGTGGTRRKGHRCVEGQRKETRVGKGRK